MCHILRAYHGYVQRNAFVSKAERKTLAAVFNLMFGSHKQCESRDKYHNTCHVRATWSAKDFSALLLPPAISVQGYFKVCSLLLTGLTGSTQMA